MNTLQTSATAACNSGLQKITSLQCFDITGQQDGNPACNNLTKTSLFVYLVQCEASLEKKVS